jgi:hypothetical protein
VPRFRKYTCIHIHTYMHTTYIYTHTIIHTVTHTSVSSPHRSIDSMSFTMISGTPSLSPVTYDAIQGAGERNEDTNECTTCDKIRHKMEVVEADSTAATSTWSARGTPNVLPLRCAVGKSIGVLEEEHGTARWSVHLRWQTTPQRSHWTVWK